MTSAMTVLGFAVSFFAGAVHATTLGVDGTRFVLNGKPTFLLGCSYYGALGAPPHTRASDLDRLRRLGINWVRVWATWDAFGEDLSAVTTSGEPREPYLSRLRTIIRECDRRGMVVDVTLHRDRGKLADLASHRRAVETIVVALRDFRNWYLDLANERNVRDARYVSVHELAELRRTARHLLPRLLVTASQGGDLSEEDVRRLVTEVGLDFLTPHRPRHPASPSETEKTTRQLLAWLTNLGNAVPVHYQEPFRRDYGEWQPAQRDFLTDLEAAVRGGAAGWCFHNGSSRRSSDGEPRRSFDLRRRSLFEQLDTEELATVANLKRVADASATEREERHR